MGTDGDGTVPLLSLGYMCAHGWHQKRWNPHGVKVVTREYTHKFLDLVGDAMATAGPRYFFRDFGRGGPSTADHVNLMGNSNLLHDVLTELTNPNPQSLGTNV